jgi:hypothetical protein
VLTLTVERYANGPNNNTAMPVTFFLRNSCASSLQ